MTETPRPARPVRLLLSDVDGTLVTRDKKLLPATVEAVAKLRAAGIAFTVTSARPPQGLAMLAEPLKFDLPIGGFNGGLLMTPDFKPIEERRIDAAAAREVVETLQAAGVSIWLFTATDWVITDPNGPRVDHETFTIGYGPKIVDAFGPEEFEGAIKIVGVSDDHPALERLEGQLQESFGRRIAASRSQVYYLDVTHPEATKGTVVERLAVHLGIDQDEIAVIGDSANDVAMFEKAGFSIAMGNASDKVKAAADAVSDSNEAAGVAVAIERFILPR